MTHWTLEHGMYGCDTGCCGYRLTSLTAAEWTFDHPDDETTDEVLIAFARKTFKEIQPEDSVQIGAWRSCEIP